MNKDWSKIEVKAWEASNFLFETYSYSIGKVEPLSSHVHPEYQFAWSLNRVGIYFYRGIRLQFPIGSLCVLHSGEPHAPSDRRMVVSPAFYRMLYIQPEEIMSVVNEISERQFSELPYFPQIVFRSRKLIELFLNLFLLQSSKTSKLEKEEMRLGFLVHLISGFAQNRPPISSFKRNAPVVRRAADFINDNFLLDISLDELARVSGGVNKFHLCRAFRKEIGIPPHLYQNQLRISHAKRLLLSGLSVAETAAATGFYDQSHFGKYFKRMVGVPPRSYLK